MPLSTVNPAAYWPTALAVLAWQKSAGQVDSVQRAVSFLINNTGLHFTKTKDSVSEHDTEIKGWPWVENTHSWVEPTSMAVLALRSSGHGEHPRVLEAVRMLLDRQLPSGGWNMGNTLVLGKELLPFPESTGHALTALNSFTNTEVVQKSLDYLNKIIQDLRTPLGPGMGAFWPDILEPQAGKLPTTHFGNSRTPGKVRALRYGLAFPINRCLLHGSRPDSFHLLRLSDMSENTDKKQQGISRRDFFKACAVVGVGVAGGLTLQEVLLRENIDLYFYRLGECRLV